MCSSIVRIQDKYMYYCGAVSGMMNLLLELVVVAAIVGLITAECPIGTFWIIDRCCVDIESKIGEQPVICDKTDSWSSSVEPCSSDTYSVDRGLLSNRDRCHLKTNCNRPHMYYKHRGSRIQNAECACNQGYYLQIKTPRNCVRNPICPIGYGQDREASPGGCVDCRVRGGFSDRQDRDQPCLKHTNCGSLGKCLLLEGSPSSDVVCTLCTKDLSTTTIEPQRQHSGTSDSTTDSTTVTVQLNATTNSVGPTSSDAPLHNIFLAIIVPVCVFIAVCIISYKWSRRCRVKKRNCRFEKELTKCREDDEFRNRVINCAMELLPRHLGKKWTRYSVLIFKGSDDNDKIHEYIKLDHSAYGTEAMIQEMFVKFKERKSTDSHAVDILFGALDEIKRGDLVEKIIDKIDYNGAECGDVELQPFNHHDVEIP